MGKTIFITEKPSVAQEYRKVLKVSSSERTNGYIEGHSGVLNRDVIITWAVGHLVSICPPERQREEWGGTWKKENLPMIPVPFKYAPLKETFNQYKIVKALYLRDDIERIYYAGDSGREGIYIQALIRNQIFKQKTPAVEERVVWIDSFTEESILNGIKTAKPYTDYLPMIDSGYMRAVSDWLIGMNFTEAFTLTSSTLINVGRVMTPTLAMVVKRQEEIDSFTRTPYFGIRADNLANWKAVKGSRFLGSEDLYNDFGFLKKEKAQQLIDELNQSRELTVDAVRVLPKTEYAPYLFNLADLQAKCTKAFRISPAKTLEIAQSLYEKKYTTYPRTDCRFLSTAVAEDLKKQGYDVPKRYIDDSKITDHYAIIPTFHGDVNALQGLERKVYDLILKRFTDTLLPPYIYDAVSVAYIHKNGEHFFEHYRIVKQLGFKANAEETQEEKDEKAEKENPNSEEAEVVLNKPVPKKGEVIPVTEFAIRELETKPPVPYTTGTLILAMEKAGKLIEDEELRETIKTSGIGTSATRANIIEKLAAKKFISVDKKQKIAPTDFGKQVIPLIAKYDEALISPIKTAEMEDKLTAIVNGEQTADEYLSYVTGYVESTTKTILSNNTEKIVNSGGAAGQGSADGLACPCCGNPIRFGKFGWFCNACNFKLNLEICGHKMKEKDIADLAKKGKTSTYTFKSPKNGKSFKACLVLDKDKHTANFQFVNDK